MSTNTSEQGFSIDVGNQLQDMLKSMDMLDDGVNQIAKDALLEGAETIAKEQRRLIASKSPILAGLIKAGRIYVTKGKGRYSVQVGYDTNAIKAHPESVILEFGRPGKKGQTEMEQNRSTFWGKKGKAQKIKVKIGKISAISHIRRGFDNKNDEAVQRSADMLDEVLKKW